MSDLKPSVYAVFATYAKVAWKRPWLLVVAIICAVGGEAASVIGPLYLRDFINILSGSTPTSSVIHALIITLAALGGVQLVGWLFTRGLDFSSAYVELRSMRDLYNEAFDKLMRHSHEFFVSNFTGTLTRRVTRYSRAFEAMLDYIVYNFIPAVAFTIGTVAVLALQSFWLGIAILVWAIVFTTLQVYLVQRLQPLRLATNEADSALTGATSDAVLNHSAVTTFASLSHERTALDLAVSRWTGTSLRSWTANMRMTAYLSLFNIAITIGIFGGAIYYWSVGILTVGDFMLIQVYVLGLLNRIWSIGRNMRNLYSSLAEATEMLEIIERPLDIVDKQGAKPIVVSEGAVTFDRVHFAYKEGSDILADFNLTIAAREKVALVGPSGAGKSTITKLLLRLYDISGGSITIDGQDIRDVTQESVRKAIAFVPQEPALFHRSLRENIRYGCPDATDEEVREAAREAHCLEFIERYPDGFDTLVGERGVKLSGGERQRVAIARAILKDAPILVLDEATSSLDSESEALIQDALAKLMEGKTVIVIAHRLSTIMKMDHIVVMEHGRVALSGTHQELLAQESNLYKKLWEIQAGGFIAD